MTATHNLNRLCFLDLRMPILNKSNILFCVYKSVVYPAQAEFSYFSLDFRMKISLKIFLAINNSLRRFRFRMYWCVNYQCSCRLVKGIILCG